MAEQRPNRTWDAATAAASYRRGEAQRAEVMVEATSLMLDLADLRPGATVLDVAAGTGEQTVLVAQRIGSSGRIFATDVASSMLEVADDRARRVGLANVETRVADARSLPFKDDTFDAAVCRHGVMFVPDPAAALAEVRRVLKPGRRFAAVVFGTPEDNPTYGVPLAIGRRRLGLAVDRLEPAHFALGDPGVLGAVFRAGGFREVDVHKLAIHWRFASAPEARQFLEQSFVTGTKLLEQLDEADRTLVWDEVEAEFRRFESSAGCTLPGELLVGAGTK